MNDAVMRKVVCAVLILTCTCCRSTSAYHDISADCRLLGGEFEVDEYIQHLSKKSPSTTTVIADTENGAFFIQFYLGNGLYRAIALSDERERMVIIDLKTGKASEMSNTTRSHVHEALLSINEGSLRQLCFNPPSEGSRSVFFVKRQSKIIFKWDAPQHDYKLLNEDEKPKVTNALQVINAMVNNGL